MQTKPPDLDTLRREVRKWAQEHVPTGWRETLTQGSETDWLQFHRDWFSVLTAGGYAAPHLPAPWGGGFGLTEQVVIQEELARADAPDPRLFTISLHHLPATLLAYGTSEQQQTHLQNMLTGTVWCQGFSEPEAGSDLASLRTRAVRDGDHYVVTGQKIWTSLGAFADWCLLLVRTDPDAPKRKGISYLLMDMRSPGVEVRPVRQITGEQEFCELFLTDVRIPVTNLVGEENRGWSVAQSTLSAERGTLTLGFAVRLSNTFDRLVQTARDTVSDFGAAMIDDPVVRDQLAMLYQRVKVVQLLCYDMVEQLECGEELETAGAIKLAFSEVVQDLTNFGVELSGLNGQIRRRHPVGDITQSGIWMADYLNSWMWTISGGSNEVLRTVVGERVLKLPRDPGM